MNASVLSRDFSEFVRNNCCYLWGGSGQKVLDTPIKTILEMEDTTTNAGRVLFHVYNLVRDKKDLTKALYFDCSGMVLYCLNHYGLFYGDTTADGLFNAGTPIKPKNTKEGDLVFNGTDKKKTHVGFVGSGGVVYEAKGRDYGVVTSHVSEWTHAAHYTWFDDLSLNRKLKVAKNIMTGVDVTNVQKALCSHGFLCAVNGSFTENTRQAVVKFQKAANLSVVSPGTVAKKTAVALGFKWV